MKAPKFFETVRLALRRRATGDIEAIFSCYAGDPEVTRFLARPQHAWAIGILRLMIRQRANGL
jgi:RimJ/RimL family protein N-acetyltransferase